MYDSQTIGQRTASDINNAMARVYSHMAIATLISMIVSYTLGTSATAMAVISQGWVQILLFISILAMAFVTPIMISAGLGIGGAFAVLAGFSALMGVAMSSVFVTFSLGSIFTAFMGAAVLFGTMSIVGYFTKRDLSQFGPMLFVALIAIIIASIINIFIGSTVLQMVISAIAIVVFLGFTAYDTQTIREQLMDGDDYRIEIMGALNLYLDFINIFINLLQLIGVAPGSDD
jgi:FtsH-binding integral membrane protein